MKISSVKELVDTFFVGIKDEKVKALLLNEPLFRELFNIESEKVAVETQCLREHKYVLMTSGYTAYKLPLRDDNTLKVIKINSAMYDFDKLNELFPDSMLEYDNEVMDDDKRKTSVTWTAVLANS